MGYITPYSVWPSPKFYATDEGRLTSLNPTAAQGQGVLTNCLLTFTYENSRGAMSRRFLIEP